MSSSSCSFWIFLFCCCLNHAIVVLMVDASPTCYEYWEAGCEGIVRKTYHELTGGDCDSAVVADDADADAAAPAWGTFCVTREHVALTELDVSSDNCRQTFGSVQGVSECVALGRGTDNQERWMYCTKTGCDSYGGMCDLEVGQEKNPGQVNLWGDATCGSTNEMEISLSTIDSDGECWALGDDIGASFRVSCINDMYMSVQLYDDLECQYEAAWATAPSFMLTDAGNIASNTCYGFQGAKGWFGMTVESPCNCGITDGNDLEDPEDIDMLRYDLMYNLTLNGTKCLEGRSLESLERELEGRTRRSVTLYITSAVLNTNQGTSWWTIDLGVRFEGIPADTVEIFQKDIDISISDGSMLGLVTNSCGASNKVNVTMVHGGSFILDYAYPEGTGPNANSSASFYGWTALPLSVSLVMLLAYGAVLVNP